MVALLASGLCSAALAQEPSIYRWVDADGHVHFGDRPPSVEAEKMKQAAATRPPAEADESRAADAAACEAAQARLASYRNADSIVEEDSLGQRRTFDDAQRQQLIARSEQRRDEACAGLAEAP